MTWPQAAKLLGPLLAQLVDANDNGLPPPHATSHLAQVGLEGGGHDGMFSVAAPAALTLDAAGVAGSPPSGGDAHGHRHALPREILAIAADAEATAAVENGQAVTVVSNPKLVELLEHVLLRLMVLTGELPADALR